MKYLRAKLLSKKPAITITRVAVKENKLVYIACANKPLKYKYGKSKIAYIGTTKKGSHRIAVSAAKKAELLLTEYGVKHLDFFVVVSSKRSNVSTWRALESSLILTFRDINGVVPKANIMGSKMNRDKKSRLYRNTNLEKIIKELEK